MTYLLKMLEHNLKKAYLDYHLDQHSGSVTKLAKTAGVERTHLYRKLHALGVEFRGKR